MEQYKNSIFQWDSQDVNGAHVIYAFGRNLQGESTAFVIKDYPIRVYYELDKLDDTALFKWNQPIARSAVATFLGTKFGYEPKRAVGDGWYVEPNGKRGQGPYKPDIVCLHGIKDPLRIKSYFLRAYYATQEAVRTAKNTINLKTAKIPIKNGKYGLEMIEDFIDPVKKLTVDRKLPWTGWISCNGNEIPLGDELRVTTCKREIHASWKTLAPDTESKRVSLASLWYDIECLGLRGLFPDKFDPRCVITAITYYIRDPNIGLNERIALVYGDAKPKPSSDLNAPPIVVINVNNERDLIRAHYDIIARYDPDIISGYNTLGFDEDYIYRRTVLLGIEIPNAVSRIIGKPIKYWDKSWASSNTNKVEVMYLDYSGRAHVDVFKHVKANLKLQNNKLDTAAKEVLGRGKHDVTPNEMFDTFNEHQRMRAVLQKCTAHYDDRGMPIPHTNVSQDVWKRIKSEYVASSAKLQVVIEYCMEDTALSMELCDKLSVVNTLLEFANIFQLRMSEVHTRGQSVKGVSQLYTMLREDIEITVLNSFDYEMTNVGYEGALNLGTLLRQKGLYRDMASLDVASMYPSQMRKHNISVDTELTEEEALTIYAGKCTRHVWSDYEGTASEKAYVAYIVNSEVRRGFFPKMLDNLIARRAEAKAMVVKTSGTPDEKIHYSRQDAMKLACNSVYGILGTSKNPRVPCKHLASLVTYLSRISLMTIYNSLKSGLPPVLWKPTVQWEADRIAADLPVIPVFPSAKVFYGDTDSVQFHFPQLTFATPLELIDFYTNLTKCINAYITPLKVELEKIGDMLLECAKHYAVRLRDTSRFGIDRKPNPSYGAWKVGIKHTGIDVVKRNKCEWHRKCLERIVGYILDADSVYSLRCPDPIEREQTILADCVDDIVITLYKAYMAQYPIELYEVFESYTKEGVKSTMGTLARRQADIGRPVKVGDRQGYVMVRFLNESSKSKIGDKARIIGDFDVSDTLDTLYYIKKTEKAYDSIMEARYNENSPEFLEFWQSKVPELAALLGITEAIQYPNIDPAVLFCNVLRDTLSQNVNYSSFIVPSTYYELETLRNSDDYVTLFPQNMRTQITRTMNKILADGWPLLLARTCNIVNKMLVSIELQKLDEFLKIILSPRAYTSLQLV